MKLETYVAIVVSVVGIYTVVSPFVTWGKISDLNREVGEISTQLENHNHTVDKHKDTSTSTASLPE